MPLTETFSKGFIFYTAIALFAGGMLAVQLTSIDHSHDGEKKITFRPGGPVPGNGFSQQKAHQGLRISIEALDEVTDDSNAKIRLHARVQLSKPADVNTPITFNWNLPSSVELLSGNAKGMIPALEVGEVWEQEILVVGLTAASDPQRLKLEVMAQMSGQPIASQGYFLTRPLQSDLTRAAYSHEKARQGVFQKTSSLGTVEGEEALPPKGIHF